jgi:hypothetical protein
MDPVRFDALSRALTTKGSRRATLSALVGALLSGVLPGGSPVTLAGGRKRNGNRSSKKAGRAKTDLGKDSGRHRRPGASKHHQMPRDQQPTDGQTADPTDEVSVAGTRKLASDEVTAASHGCRHTGARCTKPGQCCSGRCAGNGTCQLCTRASQCPAPPASEPCKKRVCTGAGKCVIRNQAEGTECSDGFDCTTGDSCDGNGRCVGTPDDTLCLRGETCTEGKCLCASGKVVCGGACVGGNCCEGDLGVTCKDGEKCCSPNGCINVLGDDVENCGDCGVVCDPDSADRCTNGTCSCGVEVCIGSEVCKVTGCECPDATACQDICEEGKVKCGVECLDCPPPPPGIPRPGDDPTTCCAGSYCPCNGRCCSEKGDCFQTFDSTTNQLVDEFCCTDSGGVVCGNECCQGPSCETGCFRMNPVGGSYRRPGR